MAAAVVWLSLTPAPPKLDFAQSDKLGHFIAYGALMLWFAQLYRGRTRLLYAAGFDVFDMFANSLGVLLGWTVALVLPRVLP